MPSRPGDFFSSSPSEQVDLFLALVDLDPDDRTARLAAIDDEALRREVAGLLAADAEADTVLRRLDRLTPSGDSGEFVGETLGPYRVQAEIGRGGMGVVYRAEDARLGRTVALKVLPPLMGADPEARARLVAEARAAGALDHPNVGTLHDIGETDDGRLYLVLAHYDGETLKARLARGPLPAREAERVVREVAAGLAAAHAASIVHRDVKPSNVLLTPSGAKVLDFGIAKGTGDDLTRTGATLGTAAYMSPEQTRGEAVDARADVWALGVVLHEMLAGARPFRGQGEALVHAIRHDDPPPLPAGTPPVLARVVRRALARDPARRYPDAAAFLADLDAEADRPARRWGWAVGAAVVAALVLLAAWALTRREAVPDDAFVIAVAPFSAVGDGAEAEAGVMQALVYRELDAVLGREPDVRLLELGGDAPASSEEARALGEDEGAHLVVWGEAVVLRDEVEIRPQLTRARPVDGVLGAPESRAEGTGTVIASLTGEDQLALRRTKAAEVGDLAFLIAAHYHATRGDFDRALALYERVRTPSVESESAAAFVLVMKGDYAAAVDRYEAVVARGEPPGIAWFGYAAALISLGRVAEAERRMRDGLERSPGDPLLTTGLAWSLGMQGRGEEAAALSARVVDMEPRTQAERLGVGWGLFMVGRYDESAQAFRALVDRAWNRTETALGYQGLATIFLNQGRFAEAEAAAAAAHRADPGDDDNGSLLAWAHLAQGEVAEAEAPLAQAAALGRDLTLPLLLAYVRARLGRPDADAPIRARVDTLHGDGYLRPLYRFALGRATEAEVLAASDRPDSTLGAPWRYSAHLYLGHLYEAGVGAVSRDSARAAEHYRRAIATGLESSLVSEVEIALARLEGRLEALAAPRPQEE